LIVLFTAGFNAYFSLASLRTLTGNCRIMNSRLFASLLLAAATSASAADLRLGIIGLDTSHVTAFTGILNDPKAKGHVEGARIVGAFKGGSPDIKDSSSRLEGFTKTLQEKYGVTIYDTIEELCQNVDAVLIESVDGRPHLAQARPVIKAHKPLFLDKPAAGTLDDGIEIYKLAAAAKVPVFSSSSLRFGKNTLAVRNGAIGTVTNAFASSPAHIEKTHPDLFWYGVHGVEALFTVMGTGCESVKRGTTPDGLIEVTGTWKGGRVGIFRESKPAKAYDGLAQGEKGEMAVGAYDGYEPLVVEIVKFFQTGVAPVSPKETIEILTFMEAADESKRQGGAEIKLKDILKKHGG
jgi:hypothetical protein